MRSNLLCGSICCVCIGTSLVTILLYRLVHNALQASGTLLHSELAWIFQLLLNLIGYATILLPFYIVYKYLEKTEYFGKLGNPSFLSRWLSTCFVGRSERLPEVREENRETATRDAAELAFCFSGLMAAYLVWGLLQEKIMTQQYVWSDGRTERFNDSQFLVFVNRGSAWLLAAARLAGSRPAASAPLFKYSFCSLSNVLSAWCQYEALKYVGFPTQVLSKSCKVIPVLMMSRLVMGTRHALYEYATAALISMGMAMFLLGSQDHHNVSHVTTASGVALLALYMTCDSFTSSWQGQLFRTYRVSPLQMMCGVNLFSVLLTAASLAQHPDTAHSLQLLKHPVFLTDVVVLSVSSTLGQLLIYRTIARFGPVVFTIIMTLRQAVAVLLSCLVYGHAVSSSGAVGVAIVFGALLLRLYCKQRRAALSKPKVEKEPLR